MISQLLASILILASLLMQSPCWAHISTIEISEINVKKSLPLSRRLEIWHNRNSEVELDQILSGAHKDKFEISDREYPTFGFGGGEQWVHFSIKNSLTIMEQIILESRYPLLDSVTLYQRDSSGQWYNQQLGDQNSEIKPFVSFRSPNFELQAYPGINDYWINIKTKGFAVLDGS